MRRTLLARGLVAAGAAFMVAAFGLAGSEPAAGTAAQSERIAFARYVFDAVTGTPHGIRIYVMNTDGSAQRRLSPATTKGADNPVWSPDGRMIAFSRSDVSASADGQVHAQIRAMNAEGGGERTLTRDAGGDGTPAWSPDGRKIAFARVVESGDSRIFVMNADGSGQRSLTRTTGTDSDPAWSPDSRKLVFASYRGRGGDKGYSQIYVMNADGSGQRRLTSGDDSDPAWSPDGRKIAFAGYPILGNRDYTRIFVINADGSGQRSLTRTVGGTSPAWSSDGHKIVFANRGIYVMNADGSGLRSLTRKRTVPYYDFHPAWWPALEISH